MRRIDKLLYHAIVPPFIIALVVLTFVVCVHEIGTRLSELLITRNAPLGILLTVTGATLPAILIFSLPLSYLIGVLIGLTGLSGESQITALRACGVPLRSLLRFIFVMGAGVGMLTALFSLVILPRSNDILRQAQQKIDISQATSLIKSRVFNEDYRGYVFYIDDLAVDKQNWSGIFIADNSDPKSPRTIIAQSGSWVGDASNRRLQLHLEGGASYAIDAENPSQDSVSVFANTDIPIESQSSPVVVDLDIKSKKVSEQYTTYLLKNFRLSSPDRQLEQIVELNRRFALPFSVFPFALLGLTLALGAPRGGKTTGFALSLTSVLVFYMLFVNGIGLALVGKINPWIGAWGANILLAAAGLLLLAKVERNLTPAHFLSRILPPVRWIRLVERFPFKMIRSRITSMDKTILNSSSRLAQYRFPRILDLYISRGFIAYFLWSMIACCTLFILFTLFDLMDDIIRNDIGINYIVEYFAFLFPQILMVIVPMSVLLAVLINFGILEKNSEITAIKSGGWSLYRVAVPVIVIASGFCIGLFLIQDYVLPAANTRQDRLWNYIKGKPPQTSMYMQRKWILGEDDRIYNYEYFNANQDSFIDLNIYDIDMERARILRRIHADRARIEPNGSWILEKGWVRDYDSRQSLFEPINSEAYNFPEKASYFKREMLQPKESSKLTYLELTNYINYLTNSGYNAIELQVELNKKISFPLSCLVMALLAVPFSFSVGRKGAFFGIGMSIAIAISYWGIAGAFEAMGTYGLLIPMLAAWAPNILFGATGLVLLFTIRT